LRRSDVAWTLAALGFLLLVLTISTFPSDVNPPGCRELDQNGSPVPVRCRVDDVWGN
jgi:hypothetical protein